MAAPTPAAYVSPAGIKLDDGYRTTITFTQDTDLSLWYKTVTPPGLDGGDPTNTTTMLNDSLRTFAPKALITMTAMTVNAAYDPDVYNQLLALINVNTTITLTFPDTSTIAFYGYLQKFEPGEMQEGEQPDASITIQPTNQDPSDGGEELPVIYSAAGT